MAGVVILAGHYIDFFNMIMPSTVEMVYWISEIVSLFFLGLFIFVVFTALQITFVTKKRNLHRRE
jgi:type II secretory pathway component PulF